MDSILSSFISSSQSDIATESALISSIQSLDSSNSSNSSQISLLQGQLAALQLDDTGAQAAVVSLTNQIASLKAQLASLPSFSALTLSQKQVSLLLQLSKANFPQNLHQLPFVTDPNARPTLEWFQPGNSGNTGGAGVAPHGPWSITPNPDGSVDFSMSPAASYDDFIWGLNLHQFLQPFHHSLQLTEFEVLDADLPNLMGIETNFEHSFNGFRFNGGIQALLGTDKDAVSGALVTNQWRYYDISAGHWFYTGIPLDRTLFGTGKRIELISEFVQSDDPTVGMTLVSLTINGVLHPLNKVTKAKATTWGPYLQTGFQLDSLSSASLAKVRVWNMALPWVA